MVATASAPASHPTKRLPAAAAATSVVPEPLNGSSTSEPTSLVARTMRSSSFSGFCVGYPVVSAMSGVFAAIAGQSVQTLPIARPSSA